MAIVRLNDIGLNFGNDRIFDHANLVLEKGDRVCLTGRNGSGKSTLLRLLTGQLTADEGELWRQSGSKFCLLEQQLPSQLELTVFETVATAFQELGERLAAFDRLATELGNQSKPDPALVEKLARWQEQIEAGEGWTIKHRIDSVLEKLSLPAHTPLRELSGGWRKRVALAHSLVQAPDVWLLDEPTNHLDIPGILWLEEVLRSFEGTLVFVSHDRQLMERLAVSVVEIDRES